MGDVHYLRPSPEAAQRLQREMNRCTCGWYKPASLHLEYAADVEGIALAIDRTATLTLSEVKVTIACPDCGAQHRWNIGKIGPTTVK